MSISEGGPNLWSRSGAFFVPATILVNDVGSIAQHYRNFDQSASVTGSGTRFPLLTPMTIQQLTEFVWTTALLRISGSYTRFNDDPVSYDATFEWGVDVLNSPPGFANKPQAEVGGRVLQTPNPGPQMTGGGVPYLYDSKPDTGPIEEVIFPSFMEQNLTLDSQELDYAAYVHDDTADITTGYYPRFKVDVGSFDGPAMWTGTAVPDPPTLGRQTGTLITPSYTGNFHFWMPDPETGSMTIEVVDVWEPPPP